MPSLETRWIVLWEKVGGSRALGEDVGLMLESRYTEPHRAYHTLDHIEACLDEFDAARKTASYPEAVEMALWFHDAIYYPRASNNEERSAALAVKILAKGRLPRRLSAYVSALIMATKHHRGSLDYDCWLTLDVDLSILGQPREVFDEYETQIRKEYDWVPAETFARKRMEVLTAFLNRPNIYLTKFFRKKYEAQARRNLTRSINRLKGWE